MKTICFIFVLSFSTYVDAWEKHFDGVNHIYFANLDTLTAQFVCGPTHSKSLMFNSVEWFGDYQQAGIINLNWYKINIDGGEDHFIVESGDEITNKDGTIVTEQFISALIQGNELNVSEAINYYRVYKKDYMIRLNGIRQFVSEFC